MSVQDPVSPSRQLGVEEVLGRVVPYRKIEGIAAVLLPFLPDGRPDFDSFANLLKFTLKSGLAPAVNMDTGYVNLISGEQQIEILRITRDVAGKSRFIAGAFIAIEDSDVIPAYARQVELVRSFGGLPILFQCAALKQMTSAQIADVYRTVARHTDALLAFELGEMFASFGQIYPLELAQEIMEIPQIQGIKHSSLNRRLEWARLEIRDRIRPDFKIYTGNDLAIDMVMYGSDYLLGLASFAPDFFARRDRCWHQGDSNFFAINDVLQAIGSYAFRPPVPAYRHSAAQFLKLRGLIACDNPHPDCPARPKTDREALRHLADRLEQLALT
ncbi:MAG TPA: dihydrodipicolinate synthase family protein [Acidobacteriota bacterium]